MNKRDITFQIGDNGCRMYAICDGQQIGNIFFVRVGTDKIIISDADVIAVETFYRNCNVVLSALVSIVIII